MQREYCCALEKRARVGALSSSGVLGLRDVGGQAPYARSFEVRRQQLKRGIEQGIEALVASLETQYGAMWPGYIARLRTTVRLSSTASIARSAAPKYHSVYAR